MAVVVSVSRQNPWVGDAAASPLTHQCREALAPAEALVQHLSPAKDEGWKNYGTAVIFFSPQFAPAPAGSVQAGAPLPAWVGLHARSQGQGIPAKGRGGSLLGVETAMWRGAGVNQWAVGYFGTARRQPSEHRSGRWAMTQGWKHFSG